MAFFILRDTYQKFLPNLDIQIAGSYRKAVARSIIVVLEASNSIESLMGTSATVR